MGLWMQCADASKWQAFTIQVWCAAARVVVGELPGNRLGPPDNLIRGSPSGPREALHDHAATGARTYLRSDLFYSITEKSCSSIWFVISSLASQWFSILNWNGFPYHPKTTFVRIDICTYISPRIISHVWVTLWSNVGSDRILVIDIRWASYYWTESTKCQRTATYA